MRKRKYRKKHNSNFIVLAIFSITFLFVGLAYANTNYVLKTTGTARVASGDSQFTLTISRSILDIGVGETDTLTATVTPGTGLEVINWSSSNTNIVTIDSNGNVTAIAEGKATITAEYKGVKANCIVTVISETNIDYSEYLTVTIDTNGEPQNNTIWWATVTITNTSGVNFKNWSCELVFPSIAEYGFAQNNQGVTIEGNTFSGTNLSGSIVLYGKISITLGYQIDKYLPVKIKNVQVTFDSEDVEATGIQLNKTEVTLLEGEADTVSASVTPINASGSIVWSSADESIAIVKNGLIRGIKEGQTTITATIGSVSASCNVVVEKATVLESIILSDTQLDLQVGDTKRITATKNPANAYGVISWISSDENVVTVDTNGNIKAIGIGTATITAQYEGINAKCSVTVSKQVFDNWITANLTIQSVGGNSIWYGELEFTNNTQYDFDSWSATIVWPDGVTTSYIYISSDNASNDTECTINGNTYSGGFFIYGTTVKFSGQFFLPEGLDWADYPAGELTLKDINIEYTPQ